MNVVFLGGVFGEQDKSEIIKCSKGAVQNAADTLQKNYIDGFCQNPDVDEVVVLNLPFIGAYPARYTVPFYRPIEKKGCRGAATIINIDFLNLTVIKNFSRTYRATRALLAQMRDRKKEYVLVCYSMHLPFLLACHFAKFMVGRRVHFCVIIPDLPEYMAVRKGVSKFIFHLFSKVSYYIVNRAHSAVVITQAMLDKFDSRLTKVLIEGIADTGYISNPDVGSGRGGYYLYTGTLDRRYGIRNLVDSYLASGVKNYNLLICGDGGDRQYVEHVASLELGVKYLGQLDREAVLDLQRNASLLINPRDNESDYTKYSFPSKIIEYMSSGTPVLMYELDGIPQAYYEYCYVISPGCDGLKEKLYELSQLDEAAFLTKGALAKRFIAENKMPGAQVGKLVDALRRSKNV